MATVEGKEIKKGIPLNKNFFLNAGGLFPAVYAGKITTIAGTFNANSDEFSQGQVLQLISQRDQSGRTPIDIAW